MPFDEYNEGGGGGGDHGPHDTELLQQVAKASLIQLHMNSEELGVCEFCAGILMQAMMMDGLCATFDKNPDDANAQRMIEDQINLLDSALDKIGKIVNKYRPTRH